GRGGGGGGGWGRGGRWPRPRERAPPRRLSLRDDDGPFRCALAGEVARDPLGRVGLLEPVDAPPRATEVRRQLRRPEPVRHRAEGVAAGAAALDPVPAPPEGGDPLPDRGPRAPQAPRELLARERRTGLARPGDEPPRGVAGERQGSGSILRFRSTAGAECVRAPTATSCTPVRAISGRRSIVTPPDTSSDTRPATARTARSRSAVVMLSSRIRSGAAATASATSESVRHSTSTGKPGDAA